MKKFEISKTRRLRETPFTKKLENYGVGGYTVYNHMLLPTYFKSMQEEYLHLKRDVQIWDVSVQRELEVYGKDAYELIQLMTCRNLSKALPNKCYYVPLVDKDGYIINDPLIIKINDQKWRICIADSDVILFAKGILSTKNLSAEIYETNISTLAIQGPKSHDLMKKVFGTKIMDLKIFNFDYFKFKETKFMISKTGFSKQGGYEIHIENTKAGLDLYDFFIKSGKEFNLKPGCPNAIERIEGALLSYGNDMDIKDNPFECGLEKYIDLKSNIKFLGKESLQKIKNNGIKKKLMGVKVDGNHINLVQEEKLINNKKEIIGYLRSAAFSPSFNKIVGLAMIKSSYANIGNTFKININNEILNGEICNLPFN